MIRNPKKNAQNREDIKTSQDGGGGLLAAIKAATELSKYSSSRPLILWLTSFSNFGQCHLSKSWTSCAPRHLESSVGYSIRKCTSTHIGSVLGLIGSVWIVGANPKGTWSIERLNFRRFGNITSSSLWYSSKRGRCIVAPLKDRLKGAQRPRKLSSLKSGHMRPTRSNMATDENWLPSLRLSQSSRITLR